MLFQLMAAYQFTPYAIPAALTAVFVLLSAALTLVTRFSRTTLALFGIALTTGAWQICRAVMDSARDEAAALLWAQLGAAFLPFVTAAIYQFVCAVLPGAHRRRITSRVAWVLAAQFALLTLTTSYFAVGVARYWWGFYPVYETGARFIYVLFLAVVFGAAVVELARGYSAFEGTERDRVRLFGVALVILVPGVVDLLPMYGIAAYPFGWLVLLASGGVTAYALRRYGMVPAVPSVVARDIISTMRDLLLVSDREGRIHFANHAACAFLGYAREELIGRRLEEVLVPADGTANAPLHGWIRDREYIFRTKMGQPIELTLSHSPLTERGEITGAVIIGRDLRERKRYEWEARRAVTLLQSTLDSTADGILVIGHGGRVLTWNQRFADMWHLSADIVEQDEQQDLIATMESQLVDPAGFRRTLESLREHPDEESVQVLELRDGRRIEQYSIGRFLDDVPLRVWSFRDMTARLSAEEALRQSEERYRTLFEQNAAGVCLFALSGRILACNATFAEMVGHDADGLRDRHARELFEREMALDDIRRRLDATPTVRGLELEFRGAGGVVVSALANVSLVGEGSDALVHMTAVDITDRKRAEQQIEHQAYHDALTQLPNRRLFVERLELSLLAAKRARGHVGVLFIDLDRFKTINDTMGHAVADALLVETAQRLRKCVRQTDTVARHGGDEFTVILPDLHQPEDAAQVAEKILERVVEPVRAGSSVVEITASIGIAVFPHDGSDIDSLLRNADDAMYRAKQAGRNTYQLCTEQLKARAQERLSMQSKLQKAMTAGELVLAYRPQLSVAADAVQAAEVLIRWNDPERGIVEPEDFIPVAEETRLVVPLSEWMLFSACRQLRQWENEGLPVRLSVNISARHFQQRDLSDVIRRALDESGADPARLEIEIRETTAMRDLGLSAELLKLIRDVGVTIAIDDFGSGHSALGSLRHLPIDAVKVDRSLVERLPGAAADAAIVDAVIAVSRSLGLRVAADGVDTREQFEFLKAHGCDAVQGSYVSPPLDAEAFGALIAERAGASRVK